MNSEARNKLKLSIFMFGQYFVWSAWFPSLGTYLSKTKGFTGAQIGTAYSAFAIGAMISPFFVGLIADRFFASERVIAVLAAVGGLTLFVIAGLETFTSFFPVMVFYCATFVPTLALGNAMAMAHLSDIKRTFPHVKIFSAVGWIAGSVTLSWLHGERSDLQFKLAGWASLALAAYSVFLPATPPKNIRVANSVRTILGVDAFRMLKRPSFATFVVCIFLISIPLKTYFVMMGIYLTELGWSNVSGKMAWAQVSDIVFLFVMPVALKRFGYKKAILIGILAWVVRFSLLGLSSANQEWQPVLIYTAILLHGVCYDFLYIAAQLYVNAEADDSNRAAAQGMIAFILWGISSLAGTLIAGKLLAMHRLAMPAGTITHDWLNAWIAPAVMAAVVMIVFAVGFRPRVATAAEKPASG